MIGPCDEVGAGLLVGRGEAVDVVGADAELLVAKLELEETALVDTAATELELELELDTIAELLELEEDGLVELEETAEVELDPVADTDGETLEELLD